MPDTIIAEWLNLPSVKFGEAVTHNGYTEIHLHRHDSTGYTCSNCGQMSFWSWDSRLVRIRDLSLTKPFSNKTWPDTWQTYQFVPFF